MAKKLKALAGSVTDNQLAATVRESAQQIWLAGLGAYAKAQEEGGKVFDALVREGESLQARTRQAADERIAEVADKTAGTWGKLEQVFEERVARAVATLGMPTRKDVEKLSKRVAELSELVELLAAEKAAQEKPAKAPAKPRAARKAAAPAVEAPAPAKPVVKAKPAVKPEPAEAAPAAEAGKADDTATVA